MFVFEHRSRNILIVKPIKTNIMKTHDYKFYDIFKEMLILRVIMLTLMLSGNLLFVRNVDAQCGYSLNFDIYEFSWTPKIQGISNNFTMEL